MPKEDVLVIGCGSGNEARDLLNEEETDMTTPTLLPSLRTFDLFGGDELTFTFGITAGEETALVSSSGFAPVSIGRPLLHSLGFHWDVHRSLGAEGLSFASDGDKDVVVAAMRWRERQAVSLLEGDDESWDVIGVVAREVIELVAREGWPTPYTCEAHARDLIGLPEEP